MKQIFKSATMIAVLSVTAVAAKAQLSSDKPAMTAQQVTELSKRNTTSTPVPATQSASDKPSMTPAQSAELMKVKNTKPATEQDSKKSTTAEPAGVKVQPTEVVNTPVSSTPVQTPATEDKKKK